VSDAAEEFRSDDNSGRRGGWIITFADLMSLLMCFFVLLLSFSEMEVLRSEDPTLYEQVRQELIERFELAPEEVFQPTWREGSPLSFQAPVTGSLLSRPAVSSLDSCPRISHAATG